ncbi:hypothetical protein MTP10_31225 [Nonomuraea sp. 3-1Str]|uniref:hypothetical protein n=1 Tax=Nonomuraea sp. 3-1Str TaxID=2929801 RepID=UPI002863F788|nr:hypothetical protein [Nonomuraea sp. 3-1Str]MDR8413192.1 hypothetical protein [Nonomuraea sp. 3-1Str]
MGGADTRRTVRQVALAQVALGFTINSLGACLVLLARDLDTPAGELAWLSSSFGAGLLVVGAAGRWALRRGPQPALLGAALVAAAGAALLATAPTAPTAAAGALLLGLGAAGLVLVTPALLSGPDAAARLTRANAAASVSALLGPLAIGTLDALSGPGRPGGFGGFGGSGGFGGLAVNGRLALLLAVPPLLFLAADAWRRGRPPRDAPGPRRDTTAGGGPSTRGSGGEPAGRPGGGAGGAESFAPGRGRAVKAWAVIVVAVSMEFCFTIWGTARLQVTGLAPGTAAAAATAFLVGMAAGRLVAPRLLARDLPVVPLGCGLTAAGTLAVSLTDAPLPVAAGLVVAGLGIAPFYPVTLARLVQVPGLTVARSSAYGALASGTAILAAPAVLAALGAALDLRAAYLVTVLPLAAVLAAATLPAARARR